MDRTSVIYHGYGARLSPLLISRALCAFALSMAIAGACGGSIGPTSATLPLESLELSGIPQSGTVGDRFPVKVTATYVHGQVEDVTSRVTWSSSNAAAAEVKGSELTLVGAGAAEIRASMEQISTSAPVSVEQRPPDRSTLSGLISDSVSKRGLPNATVQILDGMNAGQHALTDENGFYSLASLVHGTFTVRVTRGGYETLDATTELIDDRRLDLSMKPLPPPPFTGGTYDIRVSMSATRCDVKLPSSGQLVLSGSPRRLTIQVIQGFETREYSGRLEDDGTFSGSTGVAPAQVNGSDSLGHGFSTITGEIVDSDVSGTEKIGTHLCPGGLGTVTAHFSGSK